MQNIVTLLKHRHRRLRYQRVVSEGYDPFGGTVGRKKVRAKVTTPSPPDAAGEEIQSLRAEITQAVGASNLTAAVEAYLKLLEIDLHQVLPEQQQLDVANKLMHLGKHEQAAQAYEAFIRHYPKYHFLEQVQLMLGIIYVRYLDEKDRARQLLQAALEKLTDPTQKQMCQSELDRL